MDNGFKEYVIFLLLIVLFFVVTSCNYVKKSELRDLMEDELVDEFTTLDLYFNYDDSISYREARDAFNTIESELNKLY